MLYYLPHSWAVACGAAFFVFATNEKCAEEGGGVPPPASAVVAGDSPRSAGEQQMKMLLAEVRAADIAGNEYTSGAQLKQWEKQLASVTVQASRKKKYQIMGQLGWGYLNRGDLEKGIGMLEAVYAGFRDHGASDAARATTAFALGVAYFRLGETENCCALNAPESCILPLQGAAIHQNRRGSEKAIGYFLEAAQLGAGDKKLVMKTVWFLNLAAMTLGEYPDRLPPALRLPERMLGVGSGKPIFRNVAGKLGVDSDNLAGSVVAEDFDGDGDIDLITSSWDTRETLRYFENLGAGGFRDRSKEAGFEGGMGGLHLVHADYDGDGDADVYVLRGAWLGEKGCHPNSLLQNQGDGRFRDVTFECGLGDFHYPTQAAAWADYDNDGDLDLYVGNESSRLMVAPCQLFRNDGEGGFEDVTDSAGVANLRFTKGVVWGDVNGDRWPDLIVSNTGEENRLYKNLGDGSFVDVARDVGMDKPIRSFPLWTWDFDNDGHLDVFISTYCSSVEISVLYGLGGKIPEMDVAGHFRGDGKGGFENVAVRHGLGAPMLAMGCSFGDVDNDGWLDFYLGTGEPNIGAVLPNQLFINTGGDGFREAAMSVGLGHLQKGHAVAFADFDNDGDEDVFEQMGGAYPVDHFRDALYENVGNAGTHWISVRAIGTESNRSAIGARIRVVVKDDEGEDRSIYRFVGGGASFGGNPLRQHFGLGKARRVERVEVFWPMTNLTDVYEDLKVDRTIEVIEGMGAHELPLVKWKLGGGDDATGRGEVR